MDAVTLLPFIALPGALLMLATARLRRLALFRHRPAVAQALWVLPGLVYAGFGLVLMSEAVFNPASLNLWPLAVAFALVLWLVYAAAVGALAGLAALVLGRPGG